MNTPSENPPRRGPSGPSNDHAADADRPRGWRARLRPPLWAVIVALVGLVLALPLLSVGALRVIESELVRAT